MITVMLQTQEILAKKIAPEGAILGGCYQSLFVANPEKEFIGFTSNFQYPIDTYRLLRACLVSCPTNYQRA
jgi:hypothetical protein